MDYNLKMKLIKKYSYKFFKDLDKGVKDQIIVKYYKEKYNNPMHLVMAVQHISQEFRPCEIDEEIQAIPGAIMSDSYYSSWILTKLKRLLDPDTFPKANKFIRPHKLVIWRDNIKKKKEVLAQRHKIKNPSLGLYESICMECYKPYAIDIKEHPANLCVCLECSPNGVAHGSYGANSIQMKRHGMSARS